MVDSERRGGAASPVQNVERFIGSSRAHHAQDGRIEVCALPCRATPVRALANVGFQSRCGDDSSVHLAHRAGVAAKVFEQLPLRTAVTLRGFVAESPRQCFEIPAFLIQIGNGTVLDDP